MKLNIYMKGRNNSYDAKAIYEDNKITILKGSKLKDTGLGNYKRNKLAFSYRNDKKVVNKNMILLVDVVFNSPSTAAQFIVDSSRNGWKDWKNKEGKSLKEIVKGE